MRFSPDQKLYTIDQLLDGVGPGVREAAYMAADLPAPPQNPEGNALTEEQFRGLVSAINALEYALCILSSGDLQVAANRGQIADLVVSIDPILTDREGCVGSWFSPARGIRH